MKEQRLVRGTVCVCGHTCTCVCVGVPARVCVGAHACVHTCASPNQYEEEIRNAAWRNL